MLYCAARFIDHKGNNMKVSADWIEGQRFIGKSGSGHGVLMEGSQNSDGSYGASPMEFMLFGLAGCSGIDVVMILEKMRQQVTGCKVDIDADRADDYPKVFTKITAVYTVSGHNLSQEKVERAVELSAEKYCSASVMLGETADIIREIRIVETTK